MEQRPATRDDIPRVAELAARADTHWFGAPELDADEIDAYFGQVDTPEADSRLFEDGDRLLGAAFRSAVDCALWLDPAETAAIADAVVEWFADSTRPKIEVLDRDEAMRAALDRHGWRHERSSFELIRPVSDDWTIAEPSWPSGVQVRDYESDDAAAMHHLIYVDAGWADIAGHPHRDFESWRSVFISDTMVPQLQVLACRGEHLVGVATGRIFSDGSGWVAQLAVARSERGQGLGRALLLESLRRRRDAGATSLGLSVQADNRNALALYLDTGLLIDREWMEYRPA